MVDWPGGVDAGRAPGEQLAGRHLTPAELWRRLARDARRVGTFAAAIPMPVALGIVVAVSAALRFALAQRLPGPWIFADELIYSELARSVATTGEFAIRDAPMFSYGVVYPLLIAPAYALSSGVIDAYALVKTINSVLMSLAAVPAYLLARRVVGRGKALLAAVLAVSLPSLAYTGMVMTENAFYPVFLVACLALLRVLERPTARRQLVALGIVGLAFATRAQAVVLVPALVTAAAVLAVLEARSARERVRPALRAMVRQYRPTWLVVAAGFVLGVGGQLARGASPLAALGAYKGTLGQVGFARIPEWFLYHLAELDLYLGVVPFAAFLVLAVLSLRRSADRELRRFVVLSVSVIVWSALLVASFATLGEVQRVLERNLFYVAPLVLIAFLGWLDRGLPRPWRVALPVAAVAAALPALIPFRAVAIRAVTDTLAFIPWSNKLISWEDVPVGFAVLGGVLGLAFLLPRRRTGQAIALVVVGLNLYVLNVAAATMIARSSRDVVGTGIGRERDWVQRSVPEGARVAVLWWHRTGPRDLSGVDYWNRSRTVWENEFFSPAVGPVFHVEQPLPDRLATNPVSVDGRGLVRMADGRPVAAAYVLVSGGAAVRGELVAADDATGTRLYRVGGRVRVERGSEPARPRGGYR